MHAAKRPTLASKRDDGLTSRSFVGLLLTQFFGVFNDNMFRWLAVPLGKEVINPSLALSLGAICFFLPYLPLATPAGYLADRFSKRSVIVWCKVAELLLMLLGIVAVLSGSITFLFVVVGLMVRSAFFAVALWGDRGNCPSQSARQGQRLDGHGDDRLVGNGLPRGQRVIHRLERRDSEG